MSRLQHGYHLKANGIRQHLLRYGGEGRPPLLLVPGITSPAVTWGFVAERLAEHFDVHVLDVRGRGLSQAGALDYSLDAMADDVLALLDALGWREATVLGHSMGARIAIRAAARRPQRFGRLLLVDPPVTGPGRRPYPAPLSWYVDSIRLMQEGAGVEALRPFSPTWTDAQLQLRAEWLHTCDENAIVQAYEGFHRDDIHADLARLQVPGLLMVAGRGGVIEPADAEEIARLAPGLEQRVATDAGHMIPWDDEAGFFRLLGEHLQLNFQPLLQGA